MSLSGSDAGVLLPEKIRECNGDQADGPPLHLDEEQGVIGPPLIWLVQMIIPVAFDPVPRTPTIRFLRQPPTTRGVLLPGSL